MDKDDMKREALRTTSFMDITDKCEDVEQLDFSSIAGRCVSCATASGNGLGYGPMLSKWPVHGSLDVMCGLWIFMLSSMCALLNYKLTIK